MVRQISSRTSRRSLMQQLCLCWRDRRFSTLESCIYMSWMSSMASRLEDIMCRCMQLTSAGRQMACKTLLFRSKSKAFVLINKAGVRMEGQCEFNKLLELYDYHHLWVQEQLRAEVRGECGQDLAQAVLLPAEPQVWSCPVEGGAAQAHACDLFGCRSSGSVCARPLVKPLSVVFHHRGQMGSWLAGDPSASC